MHYPRQVDNLLVSFRSPQARSVGPHGPIPTEPSRYPHKRLLSCALVSPLRRRFTDHRSREVFDEQNS